MLRRYLSAFLNLGVKAADDVEVARRVWVSNLMVGITWANILASVLIGRRLDLTVIPLVAGILFLPVILLNARGHIVGSRGYLYVQMVGQVIAAQVLYGKSLDVSFLLIPNMVLPLVLFSPREKKLIIVSSLSSLGFYVATSSAFLPANEILKIDPSLLRAANLFIVCIAIAMLILLISIYINWTERHYVSLLKKKERSSVLEKEAAIGVLAAGVAHEINNPLAIIYAKIDLFLMGLQGGQLVSGDVAPQIAPLRAAANRVSRIIGSLISFAAAGTEEISSRERVDLRGLAKDITCELTVKEKAARVKVSIALGDGETVVFADRQVLFEAIHCVYDNALDAARETPDPWVELSVFREDGKCGIVVVDSGAGIPAEIRERITDPFFTTKPQGKGTGLGLSFAKGAIEGMGGELVLDASGKNTKFIIRFPDASTQGTGNRMSGKRG